MSGEYEALPVTADDGGQIHGALFLRDYFAAKAMEGMLAAGVTVDIASGPPFAARARTCYAIADAMLEARK